MSTLQYLTASGIEVTRSSEKIPFEEGLSSLLEELNQYRGFYLSSGYEYPGRYSRWDIASVRPPVEFASTGRDVEIRALNERGMLILPMLRRVIAPAEYWESFDESTEKITGRLKPLPRFFPEEERSKQPSVFSLLRTLMQEFHHTEDGRLGLVGAFGYDLLFQFDPIECKLPRSGHNDLRLFLCDDISYMDRKKEQIERFRYEFRDGDRTTNGVADTGSTIPPSAPSAAGPIVSNHTPEEYMANVERVREGMVRGDYYEVVLRQTFSTPYSGSASQLFKRIQEASPSPYEFLLQLGDEQLIGASPEMFVRVEGSRVETCPISGTATRTGDPLQDAVNIRELLNSAKEESELTMCTDVDRNDKSRVCNPGSVRVIGRRLIESYAGVFHTVDHVEGHLQPGYDALDAFLAHMWAVTVIGAPKKAAAQAIEQIEKDARGWYGGAIGMLSLSGDMNTGILIRTVHLKDGTASYPVGATLLYDSIPMAEEKETRLKATGFFRALRAESRQQSPSDQGQSRNGRAVRLLLVDNDDCFIHTLANYARQAGADVITYRAGFPLDLLDSLQPDLILISPGPGRPGDFGVPDLVSEAAKRRLPVFGVCLGLQGVVEAFGGELGVLSYPMHGKPSMVSHTGSGVFAGLPAQFQAGRYHSLFAIRDRLPECLEVTADSDDGIIMGIRHRSLPIEAVQFHPESLLSMGANCGLQLIQNVVRLCGHSQAAKVSN